MNNDVKLLRISLGRYNLFIKGQWHENMSWNDVRGKLIYHGFDPWPVLYKVVVLADSPIVEYHHIGRSKWYADGKPTPATKIRQRLKELGCDRTEIATIERVAKLCADIDIVVKEIRAEREAMEEEFTEWVLSKKSGSVPKKRSRAK